MPIPPLNDEGLLPAGVHDCTIDEVSQVFGVFRQSDRRIHLTRRLVEYVSMTRDAGVGRWLYVDGSYVTDKPEPEDVDLLLVLNDDHDLSGEVPPFEYNVRSGGYVKRKFGFDFYFGFEGDPTEEKMLSLFRRVKGYPNAEKGVLRVML